MEQILSRISEMAKIDLNKSLEQLENQYWGELTYPSYLVTTCHRLRQKPLKDFETEDLRIMIGQTISLPYLVPLALDTLGKDLLASGHFYDGDLLANVLRIKKEYWLENKHQYAVVKELIQERLPELQEHKIEYKDFLGLDIT
jgi:hypothetical protein